MHTMAQRSGHSRPEGPELTVSGNGTKNGFSLSMFSQFSRFGPSAQSACSGPQNPIQPGICRPRSDSFTNHFPVIVCPLLSPCRLWWRCAAAGVDAPPQRCQRARNDVYEVLLFSVHSHVLSHLGWTLCIGIASAGMQQQHQGQKSRNPIIKSSLAAHPSSWDDLADAPPNTDVGDGSCVMSHLGMRLEDGRWLAYELQGDPNGIPVLCAAAAASAVLSLQ